MRNHHIGRLCHALTALGIDEHWQPADLDALLDAMNRRNRHLGLDVPCADDQHNPHPVAIEGWRQGDLGGAATSGNP